MATRRYKVSVGEGPFSVTEEAGAAVDSDTVELTIECATTAVNNAGSGGAGTRAISKEEALDCIEKIKNHIIKNQWPPV